MRRAGMILAALWLATAAATAARADSSAADCLSDDNERRIAGCTVIIDNPATPPLDRSNALAIRGLALSIKGQLDRAIEDYDASLAINPNSPSALNNRAWAFYRSGRGTQGLPDVERSLMLNPESEHSWDTRAHIRQLMGNVEGALRDYEMAIHLGGERMIKLYQCGLAERGHYRGQMDGIYNAETKTALHTCVQDRECDPLPADEQCRLPTS
ncbi:tetratricopeptide repeat protein [Hyphomicrobium sp. CS1BSMeth3]|uniref:tetratricopeptide repeat protein n=1 Tax=Hyphomicrobium sp. CS1BSMeth3 TaxID=1892844 RepID=UPI0009F8D607|nr:tetratricopeptide repeat protein [Hyphomicrobium sp. CS1BSMeth3]